MDSMMGRALAVVVVMALLGGWFWRESVFEDRIAEAQVSLGGLRDRVDSIQADLVAVQASLRRKADRTEVISGLASGIYEIDPGALLVPRGCRGELVRWDFDAAPPGLPRIRPAKGVNCVGFPFPGL